MPRPKKTPAEVQVMQDHILDTAYAILQEAGPEAISSRAIAERLGMAHMSLFTYFENQAAIMRALSDREMAKWRVKWQKFEHRAQTEEIEEITVEALQFMITLARKNPHLHRLAWVLPEVSGESVEQTRLRLQVTVGTLANILKLGMERGVFAPREPLLTAATVLGMVNMPYVLFYTGKLANPTLRDKMVDEMLTAALLYLKHTG